MTPEIELELMTADPIELEVASDQEDLALEAQEYVKGSGDGSLTEEVKQALLQMAEHVAYIDEHGQDYYQDLYDALYPPRALIYISVVYDPGAAVIYESTSLDSLKQYVTVTAHYDDKTTEIIASEDYTLSGTLTVGTSVVTAEYRSKTKSFSVDVAETPTLSSITAVFTQGSAVIYNTDSLDTLKQYLVVTANYSDESSETVTDYTLSGTLTAGTSTVTVSYGGKTTTFNVTVTQYPYVFVEYIENPGDANSWIELDVVPSNTFGFKGVLSLAERTGDVFVFGTREITDGRIILGVVSANKKPYLGWGAQSSTSGITPVIEWGTPFTAELNYENDRGVYINGTDVWGTTFPALGFTPTWNFIVLGYRSTSATTGRQCRIYSFEITEGANISMNLHPCYRVADGAIGLYDSINDVFYGNSGTGTLVKGADLNG